MSELRYYRGKYKVKVLTKSSGSWIVEALDEFQDDVHGEKVEVKSGARHTVTPNLLFKKKSLAPPLKEHVYELKMEKKLEHLIAKEGREKKRK
jgi:hypothetical protein